MGAAPGRTAKAYPVYGPAPLLVDIAVKNTLVSPAMALVRLDGVGPSIISNPGKKVNILFDNIGFHTSSVAKHRSVNYSGDGIGVCWEIRIFRAAGIEHIYHNIQLTCVSSHTDLSYHLPGNWIP